MKKLAAVVAVISVAFAGQALAAMGGNAGAESGAYNLHIGKCTLYKLQVKEAEKQNIDTSTIEKPKGC